MKIFTLYRIAIVLSVVVGFSSCKDKWDEHIADSGSDTNKNLYQVISENPEFSRFAELLNSSYTKDYVTELQNSKNYTVIIPTNAAIEEASAKVNFADSLALRSFIGYHLINSVYPLNTTADTVRAKNFRNKYVDFVNGNFNNILPVKSNQVAQNGLYHVVDHALTPYKNIYSILIDFTESTLQKDALTSFDTIKVVDGKTMFYMNSTFLNEVYRPMITEKQKYTYFILKDDFYTSQYSALSPYFTTSYTTDTRPDSTTEFFTKLNLLRDLIVPGDFAESNMPDTLTSVSGFKFKVDKSQIISSQIASNGRVYYVSSLPYALKDRIRQFKIMGNQPRGFSQNDKSGVTYYRTKIDTAKKLYNDIEVYGSDVAEFFISYQNKATYKGKYKVYARAISGLQGDPQTTAFTQYVNFFDPVSKLFTKSITTSTGTTANRFTYAVTPLNHSEVYLGEYEQNAFGNLDLRLVSAAVRTAGQNTLILEYLRFEPVLP